MADKKAHEGLLGQGALVADADLVHVLVVAPAGGQTKRVSGGGRQHERERESGVPHEDVLEAAVGLVDAELGVVAGVVVIGVLLEELRVDALVAVGAAHRERVAHHAPLRVGAELGVRRDLQGRR